MLKSQERFLSLSLAVLLIPVAASANTGTIEQLISGDIVQIGDTFKARLTGIISLQKTETLGFRIYDFTKRELEGKLVKIFT